MYWDDFKKYFKEAIENSSDNELLVAWESLKNRTKFYENNILIKVAKKMDLIFVKEEYKIDYTLCKKSSIADYNVPMIFIESENNAPTTKSEVRKLCCLAAPLKVLLTCMEWSDGGNKQRYLKEWGGIINYHNLEWPQPTQTGLLVAERIGLCLKIHNLLLDSSGTVVEENILFNRVLKE